MKDENPLRLLLEKMYFQKFQNNQKIKSNGIFLKNKENSGLELYAKENELLEIHNKFIDEMIDHLITSLN